MSSPFWPLYISGNKKNTLNGKMFSNKDGVLCSPHWSEFLSFTVVRSRILLIKDVCLDSCCEEPFADYKQRHKLFHKDRHKEREVVPPPAVRWWLFLPTPAPLLRLTMRLFEVLPPCEPSPLSSPCAERSLQFSKWTSSFWGIFTGALVWFGS